MATGAIHQPSISMGKDGSTGTGERTRPAASEATAVAVLGHVLGGGRRRRGPRWGQANGRDQTVRFVAHTAPPSWWILISCWRSRGLAGRGACWDVGCGCGTVLAVSGVRVSLWLAIHGRLIHALVGANGAPGWECAEAICWCMTITYNK